MAQGSGQQRKAAARRRKDPWRRSEKLASPCQNLLDGPPSPLYVQRRMVQLARERYERALARAKRLHPGKVVTFPKTFAEFEKARSWEAGGGFYFIAPRGGGKGVPRQDDFALDEDIDETDFFEEDFSGDDGF